MPFTKETLNAVKESYTNTMVKLDKPERGIGIVGQLISRNFVPVRSMDVQAIEAIKVNIHLWFVNITNEEQEKFRTTFIHFCNEMEEAINWQKLKLSYQQSRSKQ